MTPNCPEQQQTNPPSVSITHEISSGAADSAPDLIKQSMRSIPPEGTQLASERRLPFSPPPDTTDASLSREYDETRAFLNVQLSRDPRLQPDDIVVDTDHMRQCTSCGHDAGLRERPEHLAHSAHASFTVHCTPQDVHKTFTRRWLSHFTLYSLMSRHPLSVCVLYSPGE